MSKKINNPTIGSDPEAFLWSSSLNKFVPVCGLIGGTKSEPIPVTGEGHAIQEDNCAVEFCIPPSKTPEEFLKHINFMKDHINNVILKDKGLSLAYVASARFAAEDLTDPRANEFGCSPDYNAWTYTENKVDRSDPLLRTAGFHIHLGYKDPLADVSLDWVRAMDLFVTLPSILIDKDTDRRKMYGAAGAYRLKSYGAEHRALSSYLLSSDETILFVAKGTFDAINFVNEGGIITNPKDIVKAINESDVDLALDIMDDYHIEIPKISVLQECAV